MLIIRIAKAVLVAAMALHASLVVFGNVTDYAINFSFVRNVMSMDTILPTIARSKFRRCITQPTP
jgi:predicted small integral membrane protein